MFSVNNKISKRQMFRLLTYDLMGIGTLLLPPAVASVSAKNGMFALAAGIGAGLFYCVLIGWVVGLVDDGESYPAFLRRCFGKILGTAAILGYALYFLCLGGYVAYIFGHLVVTELLKEQSFYWIAAGILGLAVYAVVQGIEGRARVYEILFWFLMAPLFLMLFFSARDVEWARLFPWYENGGQGFARGAYFSFEVFSLAGIALFLAPFAKKRKSIRGACMGAVLFSGLLLLAMYGILQGLFGTVSMQAMEYPAVTLMSMIQIPGGFLQRQDALMVAIWFFTVFALLSSSLFYAAESLKEFTKGKLEKWWLLAACVVMFAFCVCSYRSRAFTDWLHQLFLYAATPFAVLVPILAAFCVKARGKSKKAVLCAVLFLGTVFLSGCSTMELENRRFPLAMGVDKEEDSCRISYKFQDLSKIADENAKGGNATDFFIEDKDFFNGISKYANDTNKVLDYNHMKALVLSEEFVEDANALSDFLDICGKQSLIARNTLLFFAEDAAKILSLDQNLDTAIGSYLEEMIETRDDYKLKDAVTLGDLYNDMANKEQLLLVPVLSDAGGMPVIKNYYALWGGIPKGKIGINEAVLSYLSQGKLKKLMFSLEDGTAVTVNRIKARGGFSRGDEIFYHDKIHLEAVVEKDMETGSGEGERIRREIGDWVLTQLKDSAKSLLDVQEIDITNSFYKLGMYSRTKYEQYHGNPDAYLKDLRYGFEIEVVLLNERG